MNTVAAFFSDPNHGTLRLGAVPKTPRIADDSFAHGIHALILTSSPLMTGRGRSFIPVVRIMNALGSKKNTAHVVYLLNGLNRIKILVRDGT